MEITLEQKTGPDDDVRALIAALEQDLSGNYEPHQRHGLPLAAIFQPHIHFFVAYSQGRAIGCGGVAMLEGFAEIKRMYVSPDARGQGVADALMDRLQDTARAQGHSLLRLETGDSQDAACRFYARRGFIARGDFEPYSSMPAESIATSIFMEKPI